MSDNLSLKNKVVVYTYNKGYRITKEGKIVNPNRVIINGHLYNGKYSHRTFSVRYEGKSVNVRVHKLQAYQKYGDAVFEENIQVRHLDGNYDNNSWDNIALGTQSDNMMDIPKKEREKNRNNTVLFSFL